MVMPYLFRQVADVRVHMLQPFHRVTLESSTEIMRNESPFASNAQRKWMPRPCAVEAHARSYKTRLGRVFVDATALRRGGSARGY